MDRYAGKPFLRLVECYILDVIGMLNAQQQQTLAKMEPKLAQTLGHNGTWQEIIRQQMEFPESLPGDIRDMWDKYRRAAREQAVQADPDEFAIMFMDQNFPEIFE